MALKVLLTTAFALVAVWGTMVIGKHIIEEAPIRKLSITKEPKNIKELLTKQGYKFLDTEGSTDDEKWKALIKEHIKPKEETIKKIKDLILKGTENKEDSEDIKTLKNKCNELFKKAITNDEEFNLAKQNTIDWCTDKTNASHRVISLA